MSSAKIHDVVPEQHRDHSVVVQAEPIDLHVAPDGWVHDVAADERWVNSLHDAMEAARALRVASKETASVRILLAAGQHTLMRSLELTGQDSGSESCPVVIEGPPDGRAVISGGRRLASFTPVRDPYVLDRLPETIRSQVWACDLRAHDVDKDWGGLTPRFGCGGERVTERHWPEVYYNGSPLSLTQWPIDSDAHIGDVLASEHTTNHVRYETPARFIMKEAVNLAPWRVSLDAGDVWTTGMWSWLWNCSTVPVQSVDYETGALQHALPTPYGLRSGNPFHFINILEELRCPGQYYVDRKARILYLIPPEGERAPNLSHVEISLATVPFIHASDCSHVVLRNLAFEHNQGKAIVVQGGEGVVLDRCHIRRVSGDAITINGGRAHRVLNGHLHTLGAGGIRLTAGDRRALLDGDCHIENCSIHDFARIDRAYAPAVELSGCGNLVRRCDVFNSPHHGIRVEGDNHRVELCDFHHLVLEFDDEAPLEMFGNPYYRGNVFRWNSFHHVGGGHTREGQAGIRLDDYISGVMMVGNIFYGVGRGTFGAVQLHGGKDNRVEGNLFIDCQAMVSFSPWGEERWLKGLRTWSLGDRAAELTPTRVAAYPELLKVEDDFDRNIIRGNVALACTSLTLDEWGRNVVEDNAVFSRCPTWTLTDNGLPEIDFDDPVFTGSGFASIPVAEIGCYRELVRIPNPHQHRDRCDQSMEQS